MYINVPTIATGHGQLWSYTYFHRFKITDDPTFSNRPSSFGSLRFITGNLSVSVEDPEQMWNGYSHKSPINRNTTQGIRRSLLIGVIINSGIHITGRVV
jgi:hypothetical protein